MIQAKFVLSLLTALCVTLGGCAAPGAGGGGTNVTVSGLEDIPAYSGEPYVVIGDNTPDFPEEDFTTSSFEIYSALDELGRCGVAYANVGSDLMPTGERGDISSVYRVTPVFEGEELVARGVVMEAMSVEDAGEGVCFEVYVYNAQPGIAIDYATGESWPAESETTAGGDEESRYVLNTNSKKFHLPDCSGVANMSPSNRQDYTGTRQSLLDQGYEPCGICNP